ncbi:MAG TPA: hypothetical protein EYP21_06055 [Syntrophaceae bacterium]|nr:hypothetical protein [Syntrophaceae bacterium]
MKNNLAVIGSITKDLIRIGEKSKRCIGGTVYYSSLTLVKLGAKATIITKLAKADEHILEELRRVGVSIFSSYCRYTTSCENIYNQTDINKRVQFIPYLSDPITPSDIPDKIATCDIIHLGPIHKKDIAIETVSYLERNLDSVLSLDIQGYLREVDSDGNVQLRPWRNKGEVLGAIDVLKANQEEMVTLSESNNIQYGMRSIAREYDISEIIVTCGSKGSMIYLDGTIFNVPCPRALVGDATGSGDIFISSYLVARFKDKKDPLAAAKYASKITSKKIERGVTWLMC